MREKVDSQLSGEDALKTVLGLIEAYRRKSSLMIDAETQRSEKPSANYGNSTHQGGRSRSLIHHANCVVCKFLEEQGNNQNDLYSNHNNKHPVGCPKFQKMSISERIEVVK